MRNHLYGAALALLIMIPGCSSDESESTAEQASGQPAPMTRNNPDSTESTSDGMIPQDAISRCGAFTIGDAAAVLSVPAGALEDRSEVYSSKSSLCSFVVPGTAEGVAFYLAASGSVERAISEMEQGRGMAGIAQENIDRATGTTSLEPLLQSTSEIGEEAYFMEANGTLMVRVGNVQIQVLHMDDPEQMKSVGRKVAAGLQNL